jgi:hypothetical protein
MAFEDFVYHYDTVYLCRIFNKTEWKSGLAKGEWKGDSAAGCGNFDHFNKNPQVSFHAAAVVPPRCWSNWSNPVQHRFIVISLIVCCLFSSSLH